VPFQVILLIFSQVSNRVRPIGAELISVTAELPRQSHSEYAPLSQTDHRKHQFVCCLKIMKIITLADTKQ
jgi:hypothetical protein